MINNTLVYYAVGACILLGATLLYAVCLILAALLVRETRDFYRLVVKRYGSDREHTG